ncbi:MAG: serine phosphatase RsbU [candidate division Zixibacteria bacterium RBG-1]|nr:MAG: serine phosphatase RsbU [candidate division Zixibacteria bacterium RBG-1]
MTKVKEPRIKESRIRKKIDTTTTDWLVESFQVLNSTLNIDELIDIILDLTCKAVNSELSLVLLKDRKTDQLHLVSCEKDRKSLSWSLQEGILSWVVENQKPMLLNQPEQDVHFSENLQQLIGVKINNLLSVPLIRRGKLLGVLEAVNKKDAQIFTEKDLDNLTLLANQIAVALDNSILYERAKKESLRKEVLLEVGKSLSSTLELEEVLKRIIQSVKLVVTCDAVGIFLVAKKTQEVEQFEIEGYDPTLEADLNLKIGQGLIGWVAKTGEPVIVPDVRKDERYINARLATRSEMVVPIKTDGKVLGVFNLESNQLNAYAQEDLELLTAFASQAAVAIERARLHKETLEKRKLEEDLKIAREIQKTFLPKEDPSIAGFDISGINISSERVGGDYYDFIPIVENQLGVAIADSSGKGIPASLIMAAFRASLKAEIRNNYTIRTIFNKVNYLLFESLERENYVTAVYGVLDTKSKILTFSNGGHNPPILYRPNGTIEYLTEGGIALGMFPNSTYEERSIPLNKGEVIVFYTDGTTEAMNEKREEFGVKRLEEIIRNHRSLPARDLQTKIIDRINEFSGGKRSDDLTMMVIKVL